MGQYEYCRPLAGRHVVVRVSRLLTRLKRPVLFNVTRSVEKKLALMILLLLWTDYTSDTYLSFLLLEKSARASVVIKAELAVT